MRSHMRAAVLTGGLVAATAAVILSTSAAAGVGDGVTVTPVALRSETEPWRNGGTNGAISSDGRHVAFEAPGRLYVRHLATGRIESVCTSASGEAADKECSNPVLSADGRHVAFSSFAGNLVPGDTNSKSDAFVKDLRTGQVQRVSTRVDGTQVAEHSYVTSMSADATKVVFTSPGALDPAHPPVPYEPIAEQFVDQVYVKDLTTGAVTAVSATARGTLGSDLSEDGRISPDGGTVAFRSRAGNFGFDPTYYAGHVYLKDLTTGKVTALESLLDLALPEYNHVYEHSAPSRGGTRLAFSIGIDTLEDDEIHPEDHTGVLVADLHQGTVIHEVRTRTGERAHGADDPVLSADGNHLAFHSGSDDLVTGDEDSGSGIYVQDLSNRTIRRLPVSTGPGGDPASGAPTSVSADGTEVVFASDAEDPSGKKYSNYLHDLYVARL